ncbi:hypothetical protein [Photobacterium marinum]|uniref:hypothetical protein n=1 Tax=Photobacterium marinum TaxID=1056511 RepID=UPI0005620A62|nr:hypothetical protein [Photobacterium marinum]
MLTKQKVLHLILSLLKAGEIELLKNGSLLRCESCSDVDKEKIKTVGILMAEIYDSYDYFLSLEFLNSVDGKSEKYREMKVKMESTAPKKQKHKEEFMSSVRELQDSRRIYDLIQPSVYEKMDEVVRLLSELNLASK